MDHLKNDVSIFGDDDADAKEGEDGDGDEDDAKEHEDVDGDSPGRGW